MTKSTWILSAVLAVGLSGVVACDGRPSPATTVACSSVASLTVTGPPGASGLFVTVKVITIEDPGSAFGTQPGTGLVAAIYGDSDSVAFCEGRCSAADGFNESIDVRTDDNGVLEYTVRVTVPPGGRTGAITEVFGASTCTSSYSALVETEP